MASKKRTYNTRLIKQNYCYALDEIARLFSIHISSVRNWIKEGLPLIDRSRPYMAHGSELTSFIKQRQAKRKQPCKKNEFYCLKCRAPRESKNNKASIHIQSKTKLQLKGKCSVCSTTMYRAGSVKNITEYSKSFVIQKMHGRHIIECSHPTLMCHFERTNKS
jgi:hypothetical protein